MNEPATTLHKEYFPPSVLLIITSRCNLRCKMCSYGYHKGIDLPYPEFEKLALEMKANGVKIVYLSGGEPALHPDFQRMIRFLKELEFSVRLSTNGTFFTGERVKELELVDSLSISLDGPGDIHDWIRGVPGTFTKVVQAIQNIKAHYPKLSLSISVTVLPENARLIDDIIRLSLTLGISDPGFQPFVPYFSTENERAGIFRQLLESAVEVRNVFQRLSGYPEALGNIKEYYRLCQEFCAGDYHKLPPCQAGRSIFVIHPDGSIGPCSGVDSIKRTETETLRNVFQSPSYLEAMKRVACKDCSQCLFYCFYYPAIQ